MKKLIANIIAINFILLTISLKAQGFVNLNFESANVSGYSPRGPIPTADGLPGWSAYLFNSDGTNATTQVAYDGISAGGEFISIVDTNVGYSTLYPIQGKYTAWLFSGGGQEPFYSAEISQTGLVPAGTESLLFYALNFGSPFVVTLGGQVLNVVPVQTFSNYTEYGANIASFADETEALSFIQPPATGVVQPGYLELDDIQFSPTSIVPEPSIFGLTAIGAIALGRYRWRKATK